MRVHDHQAIKYNIIQRMYIQYIHIMSLWKLKAIEMYNNYNLKEICMNILHDQTSFSLFSIT